MNIALNVQEENGVYEVTLTPAIEDNVIVSAHEILINTYNIPAVLEPYTLTFTFTLPAGYSFIQNAPAVLWAAPPGTTVETQFGTEFGSVSVASDLTNCTFPVTIMAKGPSEQSYQFFFYIMDTNNSSTVDNKNPRKGPVTFVGDPTIVTDPDPG